MAEPGPEHRPFRYLKPRGQRFLLFLVSIVVRWLWVYNHSSYLNIRSVYLNGYWVLDTVLPKIRWSLPSKSLHSSCGSADAEAVIQVYREAERTTSSPCSLSLTDSLWLVSITMGIKRNIDDVPYSVKSISHNKSMLLLMLITKVSKLSHVAWSYCQHIFVVVSLSSAHSEWRSFRISPLWPLWLWLRWAIELCCVRRHF